MWWTQKSFRARGLAGVGGVGGSVRGGGLGLEGG